jgi:pimeloyl-ACP methyl ester carboxylesterase
MSNNRGYINLGDAKLYYEIAGAGQPLILVHAGFVDSRMWDDQWYVLAQHYRVIRFDMRGFGQSDRGETTFNRRDDLYQLLTQLEIKQAFFLGCSLGGEIILDLALEHPELVAALVLVSTVPRGFELQGEPPPFLLEMFAAIQQGDLELASELQNRIWIDGPFRQPNQVDPRVRLRAATMNQIALAQRSLMHIDAVPLDPPAIQRLSHIHIPTLVIAGELDHPEILRSANTLSTSIVGATTARLPGCAHLPNMEQPEVFNQIMLTFLQHCSSGGV